MLVFLLPQEVHLKSWAHAIVLRRGRGRGELGCMQSCICVLLLARAITIISPNEFASEHIGLDSLLEVTVRLTACSEEEGARVTIIR